MTLAVARRAWMPLQEVHGTGLPQLLMVTVGFPQEVIGERIEVENGRLHHNIGGTRRAATMDRRCPAHTNAATEGGTQNERATVGRVAGPTFVDLATGWGIDTPAAVAVASTGGLYLVGVRRLAARGRAWPRARSLAMAGALAAAVVATQSGVGRYEDQRLWVHMVQHVLLGMVVPLLVVLSAPVTLALQSGRRATRQALRTALRSRSARVATHPLVGWSLFGGGLVLLYLTPLLDVAARHGVVHLAVHLHVVGSGVLFLAPLVGIDALPHRLPHPARLLALLAAVPFHAVVGLAMVSSSQPLAPDTYRLLDDQRAAASLFWGAGELFALVAAAIVLHQWWAAEQRASVREDRALAAEQRVTSSRG